MFGFCATVTTMSDRSQKRVMATLKSVLKEMAKPRLTASVRKYWRENSMSIQARFRLGALLHNRNTKEDGVVTRVYQLFEGGETMYQVLVPAKHDSWVRSWVSDWAEINLELSDNAALNSARKPKTAITVLPSFKY